MAIVPVAQLTKMADILPLIIIVALISIAIDIRKIRKFLHDWYWTENYSERKNEKERRLNDNIIRNLTK